MTGFWNSLTPEYRQGILFFLAVMGAITAAAGGVRRNTRNRLERMAHAMGAQLMDGVLVGFCNGFPYRGVFINGGRYTTPALRISLHVNTDKKFVITTRHDYDLLARPWRLPSEMQDPDFASKFFLLFDDRAFAFGFLSSADRRRLIQTLSTLGVEELSLEQNALTATVRPFYVREPQDPAVYAQIVAHVGALAQGIPSSPRAFPAPPFPAAKTGLHLGSLGAFAAAGTAVGLGFLFYKPLDVFVLFWVSFFVSLLLLGGFFWAVTRRQKKISLSVLEGVLCSAATSLGVFGLALLLNGALDPSRPTEHTVEILRSGINRSGKTTTYYAVTKSWRSQRGSESFELTEPDYKRVVPQKTRLGVVTKGGRLGFEWVVSFRVEP